MESLVLEVEKRQVTGKGSVRRVRAGGKLPGIFYGPGVDSEAVAMDAVIFDRQVRDSGRAHLIELKSADQALDGKKVLIRELQEHPVTGAAMHVDLVEVPLDKPIQVMIPLNFVGKPEGVTVGGILQPILRELEISCLPTVIPEGIEVDVSALGIHQSVHLDEITLPAGASATRQDNPALVSVQPPTVTEEPEAAVDEEAAADAPAEGAEGEATPAEPSEDGDKS